MNNRDKRQLLKVAGYVTVFIGFYMIHEGTKFDDDNIIEAEVTKVEIVD